MKVKPFSLLFFCLVVYITHGQSDSKFSDKTDYFEYINKKYDIDSTKIYYTSDATKINYFLIPAFTYFFRNNKIITINEVANSLESYCPPKKLFGQLSYEFVSTLMDKRSYDANLVLKNLSSNEILDQNDDIIVIFIFSVDWKKLGVRYIKHKKKLEDLGFKTIILSNDMPSIFGVNDYSEINQIRIKKN